MKVKIPREISIGIQKYRVEYLPDEVFNDNEFGAAWHRKQLITIEPTSHYVQKYTTLLHEVMHLIEKAYSFRIPDEDVDRLASGMGEFLKDNLGIELDWSDIEGG